VTVDRRGVGLSRLQPQPEIFVNTERCVRLSICEQVDVAMARRAVRQLAPQGGLSDPAAHALATAVSEVAQNMLIHARAGELIVRVIDEPGRLGLIVIGRDAGPGIRDAVQAMQDGYSTREGLGLGLPSARRLVDDFELVSDSRRGTTVTLKKWSS
jgi:serine/threonine-protein kinase RsbT